MTNVESGFTDSGGTTALEPLSLRERRLLQTPDRFHKGPGEKSQAQPALAQILDFTPPPAGSVLAAPLPLSSTGAEVSDPLQLPQQLSELVFAAPAHRYQPDDSGDKSAARWTGRFAPRSGLTMSSALLDADAHLHEVGDSFSFLAKSQRLARIVASGTFYWGVPGFFDAIGRDIDNRSQAEAKFGGGVLLGSLLKAVLPAKGVVRGIAGTVMLGFMLWDLKKPAADAVDVAWSTDDEAKLQGASQQFGQAFGSFAWDSAIGMGGGIVGERLTGAVMLHSLGTSRYAAFESAKTNFYERRSGAVGKVIEPLSEKAEAMFARLRDSWSQEAPRSSLSLEQRRELLQNLIEHMHESKSNLLYKQPEFSNLLDGLTGAGPGSETLTVELNGKTALAMQRLFSIMSRNWKDMTPDLNGEEKPGSAESTDTTAKGNSGQERDGRIAGLNTKEEAKTERGIGAASDLLPDPEPTGKKDGSDKSGERPAAPKTTAAQEISPETLSALATEAKLRMDKWALSEADAKKGEPSKATLEDFKDMTRGPILEVSNAQRKGAMLAPEFDKSAHDLSHLIEDIKNLDGMKEAGSLAQWHALAANQIMLGNKDKLALDMLAREIWGTFVGRMRELGVIDNLLEGTEPSLNAIGEDHGSGNFTVPRMEDLLRRAITLFPRNQSELVAVFAAINFHENLGHDHIYPLIALITKQIAREELGKVMNDEYRPNVILAAVKEAFSTSHIEDSDIEVGNKRYKKSAVMAQMLIAEANENTADMIGTAASGLGTPLSTAVLLQSLRPGGLLETRNVFGKEFPDTYEPHGFDRWRVKLCAQTLRHLGKGDQLVNSYADAFDSYADKASRPGNDYVFASVDTRGLLISIKQSEWDAVIPYIVKTQFDTPLPALKTKEGMKTLTDLVPHFVETFHRVDALADKMTVAAEKGSTRLDSFDVETFRKEYTIGNLFNANLLAWARLKARGNDPARSLDHVRGIYGNLRDIFIEKNPHEVPLTPPTLDRLRSEPLKTIGLGIARTGTQALGSSSWRLWPSSHATPLAGGAGGIYGPDLLKMKKTTLKMPEQFNGPGGRDAPPS